MSPIKVILLGLICFFAGCARIVILVGSENRAEAESGIGTDNTLEVNRKLKELK